MSTPPPVATESDRLPSVGELEGLDLRGTIRGTVLGLVGLVIGLFVLGLLLHDELLATGGWFVARFGALGVFLAFRGLDCVFLPVPHDTFLMLGMAGGLSLWTVSLAGSVGSLVGGSVGYLIARKVAHRPRFQQLLQTRGRKAYLLVRKYGMVGVAMGALSPLPYTLCAWAAGALEMRFSRFFLVSLLRIPRVFFYAWLIERSLRAVATE
jgi:membrane protein YqaA with SNARE-associated domain